MDDRRSGTCSTPLRLFLPTAGRVSASGVGFTARGTMGQGDVTVRDIMSTEIVSVGRSATVAEAATLMGKLQVGSALVMDDDEVVGIFTERDIVRALAADFDAAGHEVGDWMTPQPA